MKRSHLLADAADMIRDKKKLARGTLARDKRGQTVAPDHADAVSWCATGALERRITKETGYVSRRQELFNECIAYLNRAIAEMDLPQGITEHFNPADHEDHRWARDNARTNVIVVNDRGEHHQVMEMFDLAVEHARQIETEWVAILDACGFEIRA